MDDEAVRIGRQQVAKIDTGLARANADYQEAMTACDEDLAGEAMQRYADLMAQRNNLLNAYNQQVAAEQAAQPREPTLEERRARPLSAMDWNDIVDMTRQSKYARNIRPDDPNMVAGYYEAMRRRRAGE